MFFFDGGVKSSLGYHRKFQNPRKVKGRWWKVGGWLFAVFESGRLATGLVCGLVSSAEAAVE